MFRKSFVAVSLLALSACTTHPQVIPLGMISMVAVEGAGATTQGRQPYVMTDHSLYCHAPSGSVYAIPKGYVTDFASIPPNFSWLIDPSGPYTTGSIVHDYLFAVGQPGDSEGFDHANEVFNDYMVEFGVSWRTRNSILAAVSTERARRAYGRENEWNDRFADVHTGKKVAPPFPKPVKAAFRTGFDCSQFRLEYGRLFADYSRWYDETVPSQAGQCRCGDN